MTAKILIVDDEPQLELLIRQRFRKKIRNKEYEFSFAHSGREALQIIEQNDSIDIVLSDINMPAMDGLSFLAELSKINPSIKTIMVSAYSDMQNIRVAMNRGAYDFVTKPINFEDLEATIIKVLKEIEALKLAALTREKLARIQQELNVAAEVQQSILPRNFSIVPEGSNIEIFAEMIPAKDVGGDFYDFFIIDDNRIAFAIGDVSGKGMPAALFMAVSRTFIKAIALKGKSTSDCLNQVNYLLSQDNPRLMFVTLFYGVLNLRTKELEYCNCGHNPPCLIYENGEPVFLESGENIVLGVKKDYEYLSNKMTLASGQSLVLYTDGITEAMDKESNLFEEERLLEYLQKNGKSSPQNIITGMIKTVRAFAGDEPQSDDITVMVIKQNH